MGRSSRAVRRRKIEEKNKAESRYHKDRNRNLLAKPGVHNFVIVLDHLKASFNVPKIFRSAEAFGAHAVHLVNIDWFDPAPAKGAFRKVPARFHDNIDDCFKLLHDDGYSLFALTATAENTLAQQRLPEKSAFIFGHEEKGLSFEVADHPDITCLRIPHFGSMESLNVSVAASIVMYEYSRQHIENSA